MSPNHLDFSTNVTVVSQIIVLPKMVAENDFGDSV